MSDVESRPRWYDHAGDRWIVAGLCAAARGPVRYRTRTAEHRGHASLRRGEISRAQGRTDADAGAGAELACLRAGRPRARQATARPDECFRKRTARPTAAKRGSDRADAPAR